MASHGSNNSPPATPKARGPDRDWFLPLARHLGPAYLRYSFTKGTGQEVEFLTGALGLTPGARVLDVGCGPGRHALALARRGVAVVGVDLSPDFVALARDAAGAEGLAATFEVGDVRDLDADGEYDAVICLCQGGFGLLGGRDDAGVVEPIARAVRPGGGLALTAFSAYFAVRYLEEGESFDADTAVHHEVTRATGPGGDEREFELWTTCFTSRELTLLAREAGLTVVGVHGVAPGRYREARPSLDDPELLLLARREVHVARG